MRKEKLSFFKWLGLWLEQYNSRGTEKKAIFPKLPIDQEKSRMKFPQKRM